MDATTDTFAALGRFNETQVYERTAPVATLQSELMVIADFDKEAERQSKKWGIRTAIAALVVIIGLITALTGIGNKGKGSNPVKVVTGLIFLVGGLGPAIYCGIHWRRWARRNIEDRRYLILQEIVRHLSCDMARDTPLKVTLNGNDYHKKEYLAVGDDKTVMVSGASAYRLPWLSLSGQFVDGHRFTVAATQIVKRKERRKRKYTKVKESLQERVDLEVRCKPQKYARWNDLPVVLKNQKLTLPLEDWDLQVTGERVTLSGSMPRAVKVTGRGSTGSHEEGLLQSGAILGLFALLYRALGEVRKQ